MKKELIECINQKTVDNALELQEAVASMVCSEGDLLPLSQKDLLSALKIGGEFFLLKLHYNDFASELESEKIKYKISQSISVIVSYEDDGNSFDDIQNFIKYIHDISDDKQNSTFGIKKVDKLSQYPITILFSGILPINQLKMTIGKKLYELIHSDDKYFKPRFKKFRDDLSKEINIPILPVLPALDEGIGELTVRLTELFNNRVICEFVTEKNMNKDTVELYLLKLFLVYKVLAEDSNYSKSLY